MIISYLYPGFLIGVSIHLCADLFPKAWIGFATIKVPYFLSIGPILSPIWMVINLSLGFHLALKKIYDTKEFKISVLDSNYNYGLKNLSNYDKNIFVYHFKGRFKGLMKPFYERYSKYFENK